MDSLDRLADALKRTPYETVLKKVYEEDKGSSYTFSKFNSENLWEVHHSLEHIVTSNGWSVDDFNKEFQRRYDKKQS